MRFSILITESGYFFETSAMKAKKTEPIELSSDESDTSEKEVQRKQIRKSRSRGSSKSY
jgi:hypothetical protein